MVGNIVDYLLRQGKYSFAEREFNDVDSLALCQLVYLKFDGMVGDVDSDLPPVSLQQIAARADREKLFADERYRDVNLALFTAMAASRRFGGMLLNYYENIIDVKKETQFSAVVFFPEGARPYVAFRGTDETIVGWKEDFNMAFLEPVMGQLISVKYLNHVGRRLEGNFFAGGHSKGGNFAVFAAMKCEPETEERMIHIYSHDGPGFRPEIMRGEDYDKIAGRVCRMIPRSSVVGMLLQHQGEYEVVESRSIGLLQHDPYSWLIRGADFVRVKDIRQSSKLFDDTLNEWILSLNQEQLKVFVETLFQVVSAAQVDNLVDFTAEWKKNSNKILGAIKDLDGETRGIMKNIVGKLFEIGRERVRQSRTPV